MPDFAKSSRVPDTMVNIAHLAKSNLTSSGTIQVPTSNSVEANKAAASLPYLTLTRLLRLMRRLFPEHCNEDQAHRTRSYRGRFVGQHGNGAITDHDNTARSQLS